MLPYCRARKAVVAVFGGVALLTTLFSFAPLASAQSEAAVSNAGLLVQADFVMGVANLAPADMPRLACVQTSRFPRNSEVVFRARVWDPLTGATMDDQRLSSVQVNLTDGANIEMEFGPHPPSGPASDAFWSAAWIIPKDYEPGIVGYSILATADDDRTGEFRPFNVAPSLLTVTNEVVPDVAPQR